MSKTKREYWNSLIAEQEASGLTVRPFCRERGLGEHSFYQWCKRLRESQPVSFHDASTPASPCNQTPDITVGDVPGETSWNSNAVRVLLTPTTEAWGDYDVQITSKGSNGNNFAAAPQQKSQSKSPPTPGVSVPSSTFISFNGTDVTNKSSNVIVGQLINLSVSVAAGTITRASWSVPGTITGGYAASNDVGKATPATLSGVTEAKFYWVDAGSSRTVTVNVTLDNGRTGSARTTFNVVGPSGGQIVASAKDSTAIVADRRCFVGGALCAHYGSFTAGDFGILFTHTYGIPTGYSGSFQWVQTASEISSRTPTGGNPQFLMPNPCVGLDTQYPYVIGNYANDTPAQLLQMGYSDQIRSDSFTMTLMFQPALPNSIPVPVASTSWSWSVHAISNDNGANWSIPNNGKSASGASTSKATTTFPEWTYNAQTYCHY